MMIYYKLTQLLLPFCRLDPWKIEHINHQSSIIIITIIHLPTFTLPVLSRLIEIPTNNLNFPFLSHLIEFWLRLFLSSSFAYLFLSLKQAVTIVCIVHISLNTRNARPKKELSTYSLVFTATALPARQGQEPIGRIVPVSQKIRLYSPPKGYTSSISSSALLSTWHSAAR